jgi:hypothetical protein
LISKFAQHLDCVGDHKPTMIFDDRKDVPAKRRAIDLDFDLLQTAHHFKALKLQAPSAVATPCDKNQKSLALLKSPPGFPPSRLRVGVANFELWSDTDGYSVIAKAKRLQRNKVLVVCLAACLQPFLQHSSTEPVSKDDPISHESQITSVFDSRSIGLHHVQRIFISWLLMSFAAPRVALLKFKSNFWAQLVRFHPMIAESFSLANLKGHTHSLRPRKKRRSIVVRYLKRTEPAQYSQPIPCVRSPEFVGESIVGQRIGTFVGLATR